MCLVKKIDTHPNAAIKMDIGVITKGGAMRLLVVILFLVLQNQSTNPQL